MQKLTRDDLYSLEKYAAIRNEFRAEVMEYKKNRQLSIGSNVTLYFEDRHVMHYQIQEILRTERIFEAEGIEDELETYNSMIPDGSNWKATFMIEYPDEAKRRVALTKMIGIEDKVWVKVDSFNEVYPIADEDLERDNEDKTSSVHFLRFELNQEMVGALKLGSQLSAGIDHPAYNHRVDPVPQNIRDSLVADLD
ncbi:MAG: DUF3501 family protein [Proteobacteria bacterium]|nr:DUF3501 family protein [Pseudomonadota bacterium]